MKTRLDNFLDSLERDDPAVRETKSEMRNPFRDEFEKPQHGFMVEREAIFKVTSLEEDRNIFLYNVVWKSPVWMDGRLYEDDVLKPYGDDDSFERLITGPAAHNPDTDTDTKEPQPGKDKVVMGTVKIDEEMAQDMTEAAQKYDQELFERVADGLDYHKEEPSEAASEMTKVIGESMRDIQDAVDCGEEGEPNSEQSKFSFTWDGHEIDKTRERIEVYNRKTDKSIVWKIFSFDNESEFDVFWAKLPLGADEYVNDDGVYISHFFVHMQRRQFGEEYGNLVRKARDEYMTNIIQKGENP